MELLNATRLQAGYTMGLESSGRELLVVVIKGTFVLPRQAEPVRLHEEQSPLLMADTFSGAPGFSAPVYEVDFAPRKHACDVLLVGSAHAPGGRPTTRMQVDLRVGSLHKSCAVTGHRSWEAGFTGIRPSAPEHFLKMPISYDLAFGGVDQESDDPAEHDAYMPNPVGRGFHKQLRNSWLDGRPLPCTEALGEPVTWPAESYKPMAFGPLGRVWSPRARFAGTYDSRWLDDVFPFPPADFDDRYYQAAPEDQQLPSPKTPLAVTLTNFTSDGIRTFVLPHFEAPVFFFPKRGRREDSYATLDTIVFEPDEERFTMTWRVARPLKKNMFEIAQILVGKKGREWWQRREELSFPIPVVMVPMPRKPESASTA